MKTQIRYGTFESNSSSTHSITLCLQEEFDAWKKGELLLDYYNDKFINPYTLTEEDKVEAQEEYDNNKQLFWADWDNLSEDAKNNWYERYLKVHDLYDEGFYTYDEFMENEYLETFVESYTSPSGDKIVAFGRYGYDG